MKSNVSFLFSTVQCPFRHRFSAFLHANFVFCRAILVIVLLLSLIPSPKGSLFVPPHLVPVSSFANSNFQLPNARLFRVIVHPPPLCPPPPPPSPIQSADSVPVPSLRSFHPSQKTWRVVLGELCQLPNLLRPTENCSAFAECEQLNWGIAELLNRSDLGVWRLRSCEADALFVPSAQRCLTRRSVLLQNEICSKRALRGTNDANETFGMNNERSELEDNLGDNAFSLCLPGEGVDLWMTVRRTMAAGRKCAGEKTSAKGKRGEGVPKEEKKKQQGRERGCGGHMEVVEPCRVRVGDGKSKTMRRQSAKCQCSGDNCLCLESRLPQLFSTCCCATKQTLPCQCLVPPHFFAIGDKLLPHDQLTQQNSQGMAPQQPSRANKVFEEEDNSVDAEDYVPLPVGVEQSRHCPLIDQTMPRTAQYQALCSWMLDPLVPDSESRAHFFQCQPAPFSLYCGRWQRMPCAPKTAFDATEQMCIWEEQRAEENVRFPFSGYSLGRDAQKKLHQQNSVQQCASRPASGVSAFACAPFLGLYCSTSSAPAGR